MKILNHLSTLARAVRWHRRKLAALCAALSVLTLAAALRPNPSGIELLVAARAVTAGTKLAPEDLRTVIVPQGIAPQGRITSPDQVTGRATAVDLAPGLPLTEALVVEPGRTGTSGAERLAPVKVADAAMLELVRPGDRVTIVSTGQDGQGAPVAEGVRVVQVKAEEDSSAMVVVACEKAVATRLAAWASGGALGLILG